VVGVTKRGRLTNTAAFSGSIQIRRRGRNNKGANQIKENSRCQASPTRQKSEMAKSITHEEKNDWEEKPNSGSSPKRTDTEEKRSGPGGTRLGGKVIIKQKLK